jgi:hypothetical protein
MTPRPARGRRAWFLLGLLAALAGCKDHPRAPALLDEPVYQNEREGFRFQVPDGWTQHARADVPPGPAEQERMVAEYRAKGARRPTVLRVNLVDLPASGDLAAYLARRWNEPLQPQGTPDLVEVDGVAGHHHVFAGKEGDRELLQDVYAFRRGDRTYLFTGIYAPDDDAGRQQVRRAVESIRWKKEPG